MEYNGESAVNVLIDVVRDAAAGKACKMDAWATRYPTNVVDVARVLVDLASELSSATAARKPGSTAADISASRHSRPASAALSLKQQLPPILQFSTQWPCTKYEMCEVLASLHEPKLDLSTMVAVTDGPKPGETVRPKDCHLSNVSVLQRGRNQA